MDHICILYGSPMNTICDRIIFGFLKVIKPSCSVDGSKQELIRYIYVHFSIEFRAMMSLIECNCIDVYSTIRHIRFRFIGCKFSFKLVTPRCRYIFIWLRVILHFLLSSFIVQHVSYVLLNSVSQSNSVQQNQSNSIKFKAKSAKNARKCCRIEYRIHFVEAIEWIYETGADDTKRAKTDDWLIETCLAGIIPIEMINNVWNNCASIRFPIENRAEAL